MTTVRTMIMPIALLITTKYHKRVTLLTSAPVSNTLPKTTTKNRQFLTDNDNAAVKKISTRRQCIPKAHP